MAIGCATLAQEGARVSVISIDLITPELMQEALPGDGRSKMLGGMPPFRKQVAKPEDEANS